MSEVNTFPKVAVYCPECTAILGAKNLRRHMTKKHPAYAFLNTIEHMQFVTKCVNWHQGKALRIDPKTNTVVILNPDAKRDAIGCPRSPLKMRISPSKKRTRVNIVLQGPHRLDRRRVESAFLKSSRGEQQQTAQREKSS